MTILAYVDCETTGLDARIHQPYEVCIWREDREAPRTRRLPHTLEHADGQALAIGRYWERGMAQHPDDMKLRADVARDLAGVTLVGSNPAFDAAMLTRFIGAPVWHHRMIDVAQGAMWVFGWDRPKGLADVTAELVKMHGYDIPAPDHTAEGDVRTTRAVYEALLDTRRPRGMTVEPPRRLCDPEQIDPLCPSCGMRASFRTAAGAIVHNNCEGTS